MKTIMNTMNLLLDLQLFADAGTLVNATGNYVNANTGTTTAFSGKDTLSAELKTFTENPEYRTVAVTVNVDPR